MSEEKKVDINDIIEQTKYEPGSDIMKVLEDID